MEKPKLRRQRASLWDPFVLTCNTNADLLDRFSFLLNDPLAAADPRNRIQRRALLSGVTVGLDLSYEDWREQFVFYSSIRDSPLNE